MRLPRRQFMHLAAGATALALAVIAAISFPSYSARSQTVRTIKFVVPYAPGGGASILARALADHIERMQGITTVVENRPGAATVIATEAVARSTPDGTSVLITNPPFLTNPHFRKQN